MYERNSLLPKPALDPPSSLLSMATSASGTVEATSLACGGTTSTTRQKTCTFFYVSSGTLMMQDNPVQLAIARTDSGAIGQRYNGKDYYAFGGGYTGTTSTTSIIEVFERNPALATWTTWTKSFSFPRAFHQHATAAYGSKVLWAFSMSSTSTQIAVLDLGTKILNTYSSQLAGRARVASAALGPYVYMAGGLTNIADLTSSVATVEMFDMRDNTISRPHDLRSTGYLLASSVGVRGEYAFFGGHGPTQRLVDYYTCGNSVGHFLPSSSCLLDCRCR